MKIKVNIKMGSRQVGLTLLCYDRRQGFCLLPKSNYLDALHLAAYSGPHWHGSQGPQPAF